MKSIQKPSLVKQKAIPQSFPTCNLLNNGWEQILKPSPILTDGCSNKGFLCSHGLLNPQETFSCSH